MDLVVHRRPRSARPGLWDVYEGAFGELRAAAVQRHVMFRHEFDELMTDDRVVKYLAVHPGAAQDGVDEADTGTLIGLATMTNDLSTMPLVSPEYFARRWPELYAAGEVWYVGFVAVAPGFQRSGVMGLVIEQMCAEVSSAGGVICVDICDHRETSHHLSVAIEQAATPYAPVRRVRLDAQTYWGYEFPATT